MGSLIVIAVVVGIAIFVLRSRDQTADKRYIKKSMKRAEKSRQELIRLGRLNPDGTWPEEEMASSVSSFTSTGTNYEVNTGEITCSCPDFIKSRSGFPQNDPRRLCKHIVSRMVIESHYPNGLDLYRGKLDWLAEQKSGFPKRIIVLAGETDAGEPFGFMLSEDYKKLMQSATLDELCGQSNAEWVDVFIRGERHGFCWSQCTWTQTSRNLAERDEIEEAILEHI